MSATTRLMVFSNPSSSILARSSSCLISRSLRAFFRMGRWGNFFDSITYVVYSGIIIEFILCYNTF